MGKASVEAVAGAEIGNAEAGGDLKYESFGGKKY